MLELSYAFVRYVVRGKTFERITETIYARKLDSLIVRIVNTTRIARCLLVRYVGRNNSLRRYEHGYEGKDRVYVNLVSELRRER